ncbi:MAG: hypothetical protein KDD61_00950 [Bdellovibrionales bacterium]|nr:hypothetical protein [Bdellovibrionales bacterium]
MAWSKQLVAPIEPPVALEAFQLRSSLAMKTGGSNLAGGLSFVEVLIWSQETSSSLSLPLHFPEQEPHTYPTECSSAMRRTGKTPYPQKKAQQ